MHVTEITTRAFSTYKTVDECQRELEKKQAEEIRPYTPPRVLFACNPVNVRSTDTPFLLR